MHNQPPTHDSFNHRQSSAFAERKRKIGKFARVSAFTVGAVLSAVGTVGALQPQETTAGRAVAVPAAERTGDPLEYVQSPDRNNTVAETFQKVSDRILERAKKDDASVKTYYEEPQGQPGMITQVIKRNGKEYQFRLGVAKVKDPTPVTGLYALDNNHKVLIVQGFDRPNGEINRYSYLAQPDEGRERSTAWSTEASDRPIQPGEQVKEVNPGAISRYGLTYGEALVLDRLAIDNAGYLADQAGI
ncbi:MAG TPA: hypothetical protein VF733_01845 [Candidatus Saccharimonadales bacterium]